MPSQELTEYADRARQQSEVFLQRSREQMMAAVQAQQAAMAQGMSYYGGVTPMGGGTGYPMAGSPAGRLLDTITELARRGAMAGGGALGAPVAAGVQAGAATAGFFYGNQPFGPGGVGGGALMGSNRGLGFMQTLYSAIGPNLPPLPLIGDLGRWAGQRMDMERAQAQQMASDELKYRMMGALQGGAGGAADIATFGMAGFLLRREGVGLQTVSRQAYARTLQSQLRYLTRESLEAGGAGQYAGPFSTGVTRAGAMAALEEFAPRMGEMQREMGLSRREVESLQGRAMGTMGTARMNELMRTRGFGGLAAETTRQAFAVRDIQRTLNVSEKEADEFFSTMGEVYGTADRVARMAREAERHAGRWGMNKRLIFDMMREFEDVGRTTAIGAERARSMGMNFVDQMRSQQRLGIITREELFMYGGRTSEEALGIQARVQTQRNIGMLEQGRLGGLDVMMRAAPGGFSRFMGGGMGEFEIAGAVGAAYARNPLAGLEARYDPNVRAQAGRLGMMMQFQRVMGMRERGLFMFGGRQAEMLRQFETFTGMPPMEAARWFNVFQREQDQFGRMSKGMTGDTRQHARNLQNIYTQMQAQNLLGYGAQISGNPHEAALQVYQMATANGTKPYDPSVSVEDHLRKLAAGKGETIGDLAAGVRRAGGGMVGGGAVAAGEVETPWRDVRRLGAAYAGTMLAPIEAIGGTVAEGIGSAIFGVNRVHPMALTQGLYRAIRGSGAEERIGAARGAMTSRQLGELTGFLRERGVSDTGISSLVFGTQTGQRELNISYERKAGITRRLSNFIGGVFGGGGGGTDDVSLSFALGQEGTVQMTRRVRGEVVDDMNVRMEEIATKLNAQEADLFYKQTGIALSQLSGPGLEQKMRELQASGQITTKENALFRGIQMQKVKGFTESVWGEKAPSSLYEFARKLAQSTGDPDAMNKIGALAPGMVGFTEAYGFGGDRFYLKNLAALTGAFGEQDTASALSSAFSAAGVQGWDVGKISKGLGGKDQRLAGELRTVLQRGDVAQEVLMQMMKAQDLENAGSPLGSEQRPMWVRNVDPKKTNQTATPQT